MIRKAIIVVLMLAAIGIYSVHFVHYFVPAPISYFFKDSIHVYHLGRRSLSIHIQHGIGGQAWDARYEKRLVFPRWFRITRYKHPAPFTQWDVLIYVRPTIAVLAAYPTIAFICGPLRRWRRRQRGLCITCGYDLTGNTTDVCSECGTAVGRA